MHEEDLPPMSDRSLSQKERDIIEIAKLIQKATATTNNLLENTDHFKFRFKKNEPNTMAAVNPSAKQQPPSSSALSHHDQKKPQYDTDSQILNNLDMMIQNLQEQKLQSSVQYRSYTQ
jgi:hypothetical protein